MELFQGYTGLGDAFLCYLVSSVYLLALNSAHHRHSLHPGVPGIHRMALCTGVCLHCTVASLALFSFHPQRPCRCTLHPSPEWARADFQVCYMSCQPHATLVHTQGSAEQPMHTTQQPSLGQSQPHARWSLSSPAPSSVCRSAAKPSAQPQPAPYAPQPTAARRPPAPGPLSGSAAPSQAPVCLTSCAAWG